MWNECKENLAWRLHKKILNDIELSKRYPERYTPKDLDHLRREYGTLLFDINLGPTDTWSVKAATRYARYGIPPVFEHGYGRNACGAFLWRFFNKHPDAPYDIFKDMLVLMCQTNRTTQQENQQLAVVQNEQPFGVLWTQERIYREASVPILDIPLPEGRKAWSQGLMKTTLQNMGVK